MYGSVANDRPLTVADLHAMRERDEPIACMTVYDAGFAAALDGAGMDVLLVGDSLGMVVQGHETTLPVTMDQMVYHCQAVARGSRHAFRIGDMPFMSFHDAEHALVNAGRLIAEGGMSMVKLEGAGRVVAITRRLVEGGIPVCGHLGLTPQSVHQLGGFRVQGREESAAHTLVKDARALADAGAALLVLEAVPDDLARQITQAVRIPTIGIGAGVDCSGQVLVLHDALGLGGDRKPRFVRNFLAEGGSIAGAARAYVDAVKARSYPGKDESYG